MRRTVKGQIRDESDLPLPGVTVMLPEIGQKLVTDEMGFFQFASVAGAAPKLIAFQAMKDGYKSIDGVLWSNKRFLFNIRKMKRLK